MRIVGKVLFMTAMVSVLLLTLYFGFMINAGR